MRYVLWMLLFVSLNVLAAKPPDVLLLNTYNGEQVEGWLISEKYDGVRAYWDGKTLWSRQGHAIVPPDWFVRHFPPFALDGELWLGRGRFEQTLSVVRTQTADVGWDKMAFYVFDVPDQAGGLLARLAVLQHYLQRHQQPYIRVMAQQPLVSMNQLAPWLARVVDAGGEGLVIREPNQPYIRGRTPFALKYKPQYDAECEVTGYLAGKGKYEGQVGALLCRNEQGQTLRLGSGLSDLQRQQPPKIGEQVSYRYSGFTQKGHPKHAVFWRLRPSP